MTGTNLTAEAIAAQELDEFRSAGWMKLIAPAKVNLHLAVGARRPDGYHDAATVMHTLNLHDVVYLRRSPEVDGPAVSMVGRGGISVPAIASEDNIAHRAIVELAQRANRDCSDIEVRIEKNVPAQAGLGGGSSDAAATLIGVARLWGLAEDDPAIEEIARGLGADVAFFLHGGCAYLDGVGGDFAHALEPMRAAVALVKPEGGVSTADAYRAFDESPLLASDERAAQVAAAKSADEIEPFNSLAPASEHLMPELAEIREWLDELPGVSATLLCGSGSCTFAICDNFSTAANVVGLARNRGLWGRATSFGAARAAVMPDTGGSA